MSGFMNIIRPTHLTLSNPSHPLQSIVEMGEDPWFRSPRHHRGGSSPYPHRFEDYFFAPRFDVRVSDDAYFLDGEFSGVENKDLINLEVIEPRTLVVTAHVSRVDLKKEWGLVPVTAGGSHQADTATPSHPQRTQTSSSMSEKPVGEVESRHREREQLPPPPPPPPIYPGPPVEPVIWVSERQVGHLQRSFTFPSDVDMSSLSARFKDGLLKIMVRKVVATESKSRKKLNIED